MYQFNSITITSPKLYKISLYKTGKQKSKLGILSISKSILPTFFVNIKRKTREDF